MTPPLPCCAPEAARYLAAADPLLGNLIARVGPCQVEPPPKIDLFAALLRSIIYQQLHARAASAIYERVCGALARRETETPISAVALLKVSDAELRGCGLSANKLRAVRDLATRTNDGTLPAARLIPTLTDADLLARLTTIRGVGPWTVQMLMIFHLGRPDVLPTNDFAVNQAFSRLFRRGRPIKPAILVRHARRWQPFRSVATWYLWRSLALPPEALLPVAPPPQPRRTRGPHQLGTV